MEEISEYTFYIIVCNDPRVTDCYVGSSKCFYMRKYRHKHNCLNPKSEKHHLKLYKTIRNNGGWNNWKIYVIDKMVCNKTNARFHEHFLTTHIRTNLNMRRASRNNHFGF